MADNAEKVKDIIEKELGVEREKLTSDASEQVNYIDR